MLKIMMLKLIFEFFLINYFLRLKIDLKNFLTDAHQVITGKNEYDFIF
jgi:hypothetical protein